MDSGLSYIVVVNAFLHSYPGTCIFELDSQD